MVLEVRSQNLFFCTPGQLLSRRSDPDAAGVGADVRHRDPEPVAAGAPGAEGVLLLHHGGHQQAESPVGAQHTQKPECWLRSM